MPAPRLLNVKGVTFTPLPSGTPIPILGVTGFNYQPNAQIIRGAGDGDIGSSSINMVGIEQRITLDIEGLEVLALLSPGMRGTLNFTHMSEDGDVAGSMDYTITNAMIEDTPRTSRYRQYGTGQIQIGTLWPDGMTNPISVVVRGT